MRGPLPSVASPSAEAEGPRNPKAEEAMEAQEESGEGGSAELRGTAIGGGPDREAAETGGRDEGTPNAKREVQGSGTAQEQDEGGRDRDELERDTGPGAEFELEEDEAEEEGFEGGIGEDGCC